MAIYLQATMSAGCDIHIRNEAKGSPIAKTVKVIHIKGGANVRDKNSIFTPKGALTEVSDADYELLKQEPTFARMVKNGFIVATNDHHLDVKDNEAKDKSAQKDDSYYKETRAESESPVPVAEPLAPGA